MEIFRGLRPEELQRLVRSLGKRMGLRFSASAIDYLYERYGCHPYLTRIACSLTHLTVADHGKKRADERTRTADLSSLRVRCSLAEGTLADAPPPYAFDNITLLGAVLC